MSWDSRLSKPIRLKDGRELVTLRDAGNLLSTDPQFKAIIKDSAFAKALNLIMVAVETNKRADITLASEQLKVVLNFHRFT